jgi:hypothetical protein
MIERTSVAPHPGRAAGRRGATLLVALALALAGCGQKGALTLPPATGASGAASAPAR